MSEENDQPGTFLTFKLNDETYGLTIDRVREIVECDSAITPVPRTPSFMRGVMNLRGNVVPVVDMNRKLDLPPTEPTPDTCIIILEIGAEEETLVLGVLVDGVEEVLELSAEDLLVAPPAGTSLRPEFLSGMAKTESGDFIMMVEIDAVLSPGELAPGAERAAAAAQPQP